ncbi:MAG: hypothetical protein QW331_01155 [Candidatus Woesearchaeota archaeon]
MGRRLFLLLFVILVIGCSKSYEVYEAPKQTTQVQPSEQSFKKLQQENKSQHLAEEKTSLVSDIFPGIGTGSPRRTSEGIENQRILEAISKDGIYWIKTEFVLSDQASSPSAMIDKEGRLRVYYMDSWNNGISVAIKDNGKWVYKKVKVASNAAYPEVVLLSDGNYRMYYYALLFTNTPAQKFDVKYKINSAISNDGINFVEEGESYSDNEPIGHPDFFYESNSPRMFITRDKNLDLLKSGDGRKWTKDPDFIADCTKSDTIKIPAGYRMHCEVFLDGKTKLFSYFSADGRKWKKEFVKIEPSLKIEKRMTGNPTVAILKDGSYVMYYTTYIN